MAGILATEKNLKDFYSYNKLFYLLVLCSIILAYLGPYLAIPRFKEISFYRVIQITIAPFLIFIPVKFNKDILSQNKPFILLLLFVLYAFFTSFLSSDISRSFEYVYFLSSGLIISLLILYFFTSDMNKIVVYGLLILTAANFFVAPFEILRNVHLPYSTAIDKTRLENLPSGFYTNPNDLGTVLAMAAWFFALLPIWKKDTRWTVPALGCFATSVALLFFTGSRGGWLGFVFSVAGIGFLYARKFIYVYREKPAELVILGLAAIFMFGLFISVFSPGVSALLPGRVKNKLEAMTASSYNAENPEIKSANFRVESIKLSLRSLSGKPLGSGPGMSDIIIGTTFFRSDVYSPHNMWAEISINYGIPGLLLFTVFYFSLLFNLYNIFYSAQDGFIRYLSAASFVSLVGFIIGSSSPSSVWRGFPVMWTIFGLALYTIRCHSKKQ